MLCERFIFVAFLGREISIFVSVDLKVLFVPLENVRAQSFSLEPSCFGIHQCALCSRPLLITAQLLLKRQPLYKELYYYYLFLEKRKIAYVYQEQDWAKIWSLGNITWNAFYVRRYNMYYAMFFAIIKMNFSLFPLQDILPPNWAIISVLTVCAYKGRY